MSKRRALFWCFIITALLTALVLFVKQNTHISLPQVLPAQSVPPGHYLVTEVYDGDTIAVDMNGATERIRMIGVDTPETHKPNAPVQCYGPQASDYTTKNLDGQAVRLEADPTNDNRDRYGRLLRYVYLQDGTLWNQRLIEQGYGFAYLSFPFEKSADFAASQQAAQNQHQGLWAACQTTLQGTRWQTNNL